MVAIFMEDEEHIAIQNRILNHFGFNIFHDFCDEVVDVGSEGFAEIGPVLVFDVRQFGFIGEGPHEAVAVSRFEVGFNHFADLVFADGVHRISLHGLQDGFQILVLINPFEIQGEISQYPQEIWAEILNFKPRAFGALTSDLYIFAEIENQIHVFECLFVDVSDLVVEEHAGEEDGEGEDFGVDGRVALRRVKTFRVQEQEYGVR
jgi:hypothetical protein